MLERGQYMLVVDLRGQYMLERGQYMLVVDLRGQYMLAVDLNSYKYP